MNSKSLVGLNRQISSSNTNPISCSILVSHTYILACLGITTAPTFIDFSHNNVILCEIIFAEDIRNKDLVLVPSESTNENEDQERAFIDDETNYDVFRATNQWQTVKEGQSIPPGLHVQINLQTGEKQAKLIDKNQIDESENNKAHSAQSSTKQKYVKIDKNIISKQKLKDALKDFKDKFHSEDLHDELSSTHGKECHQSFLKARSNRNKSYKDCQSQIVAGDILSFRI